jgi:hypothetical protein
LSVSTQKQPENQKKIERLSGMLGIAIRVHCIFPKNEISEEENKMRLMVYIRLHLMGCQDGGHMTNFLKW